MASVTVALKDNDEGEWYSFLLSPEEESKLTQDPSYASFLLSSVKRKKVTVVTAAQQNIQTEEIVAGQTHHDSSNQLGDVDEQSSVVVEQMLDQTAKDVKIVTTEALPVATLTASTGQEDSSGDIFEHRFVWNYPAVADLIALVKTKQAKFSNPHIKRKTIWREIGKSMFEKGYPVTSDYCERKWRNLRGTYKAILYKCQKNPNAKKSWEFFHDMNDVLKDDPTLHSLSLGGATSLSETVEQPQATTIRVVSAGGATYHIIEQPPPRPKVVPVRRTQNNSVLPCRIDSVASLSMPTSVAAPSVSTTTLLAGPATKVVTGNSASVSGTGNPQSGTKRKSQLESEPEWFVAFKREMRESNERNLREIREMHQENLRVLKERNQVIRELVLALLKTNDATADDVAVVKAAEDGRGLAGSIT